MINIGVIGYGYWGPNRVRNLAETPGAAVAAIADLDTAKLGIVQRRYPAVKTTTDFQDLLRDVSIDAIAVATPVTTHFELGMAALRPASTCGLKSRWPRRHFRHASSSTKPNGASAR